MATSVQYTAAPTLEVAQISTANTGRDGTGTLVTVASGPSATAGSGVGKRINRVTVTATGTTTAGMVRFFLSTDNGTTNRLVAELSVTAITPSSTTQAFVNTVPALVGLILPGGNTNLLRASTEKGETFNVTVEGGTL